MEKLLELKGIKTVSYVIGQNVKHRFAYTENMRTNLVFIEIYESENIDDPESDEGYKTSIAVFIQYEDKCFEYTILFDTNPYLAQISLYRVVLDTVEIIETCGLTSLPECLEQIAIASLTTDIYSDKQWRDDFNRRIKKKISQVSALIKQSANAGKSDTNHRNNKW